MSQKAVAASATSWPLVSVIIPTYNRKESLRLLLASLCEQTFPAANFEVIVTDDGSTDGTEEIRQAWFPFSLRHIWQENKGGVNARNHGARIASGEILVFLDDDMTPDAGYLKALTDQISNSQHLLGRGRLVPWDGYESLFARRHGVHLDQSPSAVGSFSSNNLAIRADDFSLLGGWQEVLPDANEHRGGIWSDLEFAVRAKTSGYDLVTVQNARIVHRDYAMSTLDSACRRAYMVSRMAVLTLARHPFLTPYMPMIREKQPIDWRGDSPSLILSKISRQSIWSRPGMWVMKNTVPFLEESAPESKLLLLFYRWIISGFIFRGYRDGLRQLSLQNGLKRR